jgi:hypothetical protein
MNLAKEEKAHGTAGYVTNPLLVDREGEFLVQVYCCMPGILFPSNPQTYHHYRLHQEGWLMIRIKRRSMKEWPVGMKLLKVGLDIW